MKLLSLLKGFKKRRENSKLKPNKDFNFKEDYYESNLLEGFKFIYCNNYTDKLYHDSQNELSFISCSITLPKTIKVLEDVINFNNEYENINISNLYNYNNIILELNENNTVIYLKGDINFYQTICNDIHNNIITKYIRNNILPNDIPINTPNEYLDNIYNSITNPCKDIDILFIENNKEQNPLRTVIGLSISIDKKCEEIIVGTKYKIFNKRFIIYIELSNIPNDKILYLIDNVKYGNKLLELIHPSIDDIDSEIDEIIED